MRTPATLLALATAVALLASACALAATTSPSQPPSPSDPPPADGPWLSMRVDQAIPPIERFGWLPPVVITSDGIVLSPGAVPAIFPGPQVSPIVGRQISDAGRGQILGWARNLGLLAGKTDFTDAAAAPGQAIGTIRLTVDGAIVQLTGDPGRVMMCIREPCNPAQGTPEAFGAFWQRVGDLSTSLRGELGPEAIWEPHGYALLIGPAPKPEPGLFQPILDWPLARPLATLGAPVGGDGRRCATVVGDEAAALGPALRAATQLTPWVQDPETSATFGLVVRPLLPGEDVCAELFGAG